MKYQPLVSLSQYIMSVYHLCKKDEYHQWFPARLLASEQLEVLLCLN